jgi:glycyl-tRNA synthetase alpha subunit
MKIIATIGDGNFLAELDYREIDFLAGKTVGNKSGYYSYDRTIKSGTTFNIVEAFEQIHRNNQRKSQIETIRQTLNMMLIGLDMVDPLIEEPKVEEEKP